MSQEVRNVPPNGGWGWVVCMAFTINNILVYPLVVGLNLVFQQTFPGFGISGTWTSFIVNSHQGFGMLLSVFNNRLIKNYGYRKTATIGSVLIFLGVIISSEASSTVAFIISYSLMTSIGLSLMMGSFSAAVNCYFTSNKETAMHIAMLGIGLGSILMPHLMNLLMMYFEIKWVIALLAAISIHSFSTAMLLRPIKWYYQTATAIPVNTIKPEVKASKFRFKEYEMQDMSKSTEYLKDNNKGFLNNNEVNQVLTKMDERPKSPVTVDSTSRPTSFTWWKSPSIEVNLASCEDIFKDFVVHTAPLDDDVESAQVEDEVFEPERDVEVVEEEKLNKMTYRYQVDKAFSKNYLKDRLFLILMLGMTLEASSEISFTMLTPFMLGDLSFTATEIATVVSLISIADFVYRFASPFIGIWCHKSSRVMYMMSLFMLIFSRTTFYFAFSFQSMMFVAVALGISKGVRSVYINQVIPKRLITKNSIITATNIQMVMCGIALIIIGPILGQLKDRYNSYDNSIIFMNIMTGITIILWTVEYVYFYFSTRNR